MFSFHLTGVRYSQMAGWINLPFEIWFGLGQGRIVLTQNCGSEFIFNHAGIGRAETIKIS